MNIRSPLSRYVAILLISALFWHPVIVLADGIVVAPGSGNTSLDRAGNGVPVVDIATPNGRGLSHNTFTDYNVGRRGVILNNATRKLQSTELGGLIVGNPNLRGQAARLIINEVNGGRPSQLEGYTEVAGSAANVVVANPYGITCNGCGFINSPRVTLSTGQPIIEDGDLERFAVDQGRVAIEGLGLDATQVDQFDIITRAAEINAAIHAKHLNVITGANDVDAETLATSARQGTGEAPALAIDSSALGGMYAGSIRLVGTESGVGVKLAGDMAASDGDIQIDANGQLRLANASSSGTIQAKATYATLSGNVHGSQAVTVRTRDDLDIDVDSRLTSAGNITLNAGQTIDHQGTVIAGIENDTFQPGADLTVRTEQLDNHGHLAATQTLTVTTTAATHNHGRLLASEIAVDTATLDNHPDGLIAAGTIEIDADSVDNSGATIEATDTLTVDANKLTNTNGDLRALGGDTSRLTITGTLDNHNGRLEVASDNATLDAGTLLNDQGQLTHTGSGLLRLDADSVTNTGGQVHGTGSGEVTLDRLDDVGEWKFNDALGFTLDQGLTLVAGDTITSATSLNLKMASLDNRGELLANDALAIHASGDITNHGLISTRGDLDVTARHLTQLDGRLASGGTSTYHLDGKLDNQGFLTGIGDITITTAHLDNHGTLGSQGNLNIDSSGRIDNRSDSLLFAGGDMTLFGTHLFNRYGEIYSRGNLDFARNDDHAMAERLENRSGTIEAEGNITLSALEFLNVKDAYEEVFELADREIATENYVAKRYRHWLGRNNNNGSIPDVWVLVSRMVFQDFSVTDILKNKVVVDSPGSQIVAGENLLIKSADFLNGNSLMAANGNVEIESDHFHNRGSSSTITTRVRQYGRDIEFLDGVQVYQVSDLKSGYAADIAKLEDIINGIYENNPKEAARRMLEQMEKEGPLSPGSSYLITDQRYDSGNGYSVPWLLYTDTESWNQPSGSSAPLPSFFADMALKSDTQAYETTGTLSHAMIQAGKQVTINASNSLQNGAIRNNTRTQINGNLGNSVTGGPVNSLDITLNRRSTDATPSSPPDGTGAYHDVPFERVSPTQLSSFRLPQGRYGLFVRNTSPQSRYLIETNPEFTSADQLMGSDYLLDKLDYTADGAYQLLGDGRYESRLIRDAVLANTGQRFLNDSLDDDYAQYRQLMDNAVAAKDALRLSVGVGLTPAQTAALTHDIVWLEEQQVDGQTVLAPVLYLAQVDERNVRGASLIQGRDIDLIAGGDLVNVGTIRADNDLTASTGGSILQGGLIDAGERLDLSAQDSIRNALAGEIRGGQVSLTATEGDIVNDRSAITAGYDKSYETYLGEGGLISARDGLALSAGRDIVNRAEIVSQGDADLQAGRDIVTEAVTDARHKASEYGIRQGSTRTTQLGASLTAGGDATLEAGRDVVVTASDIASEAALAVEAGRDIRLEAGEDTAHDWGVNMPLRARVDQRTTTQVGSQLTSVDDTRLSAGRDVRLTASEIDSGAGLAIAAGNDILLDAAENQTHTQTNERRRRSETRAVEQAGSELTAREDVALQAQRHITAIASRAEAGGNLALDAAGDLTLASAANVRHHESHTSTTDWTSRHVRQQGSNMVAGDTLTMRSGRDLRLIASDAEAGNDAFLIAGRDVELLAANDQDYSLYEKEESGLFSSSYQRDEINDIRAVGSRLESGNDLTVISGADQRYQGARLEAGNNLTLASGGTIHFEAASDFHTESHEERSGNFAWQSSQGEGRTDETLRQSQLIAKGNLVIQAADGIVAEVPEINQQTVSQTIDAMVDADPDLAWLKEMEERGDIDWRRVKEIHDSWEYEQSGLGGGVAMVIAIVAACFGQYYVAAALEGVVAGAAAMAIGAGAGSLAGTAAVSMINNRGDLGATLDDTFSNDSLRSAATAAVSAGVTKGLMRGTTNTAGLNLGTAGDIARFAGQRAAQMAIKAGVSTAIEGGSLSDNLEAGLDGVLTEVVAAVLFDAVGDQNLPSGSPQKIALHALAGGAVAEATGGDFRTGALAAGANEALVDHLAELVNDDPQLLVVASQITGIIAAELTDGDVNQGAEIAEYSTSYNYLRHDQVDAYIDELKGCEARGDCADITREYRETSLQQQEELLDFCASNPADCYDQYGHLLAGSDEFHESMQRLAASGDIPTRLNDAAGFLSQQLEAERTIISHETAHRLQQRYGLDADETSLVMDLVAAAGSGVAAKGIVGGKGRQGERPENYTPAGAGRSGAFNEAKRQAGIPTSQQPSRVVPNVDRRGNPQPGRIYEFEVPAQGGGTRVIRIRDDAGGHDYGSGNDQNRGPHFNDEAGNHYDY